MSKLSPLITLSLSATLLMVGVGMVVALLPQRVHAMTGTLESVGLIASIFALAYLLAQVPVSLLSDRLGAKRFLVIGYFLCAASGVVFFRSETVGHVYLGRFIQGLGEASIWALGPALLSLAYPAKKGRAIGLYNAAIHMGLTLGPVLSLLLAPHGQSRLPFLVFAGLCLVGGLGVLAFLRAVPICARSTGAGAGPGAQQFRALLHRRRPATLLSGVLLYGAGYGVFVSVLPVSLARTHGFDAAAVTATFVLFYAAISVAQIAAGAISDRIGRQGFLVWGMGLSAAGIGAFLFTPGLWACLPLGIASVGLGMFCVASISELNDSVPDAFKGAISGSYYFFWGAGYVLGPLLIGAVAERAALAGYLSLSVLFGLQALAVRTLHD